MKYKVWNSLGSIWRSQSHRLICFPDWQLNLGLTLLNLSYELQVQNWSSQSSHKNSIDMQCHTHFCRTNKLALAVSKKKKKKILSCQSCKANFIVKKKLFSSMSTRQSGCVNKQKWFTLDRKLVICWSETDSHIWSEKFSISTVNFKINRWCKCTFVKQCVMWTLKNIKLSILREDDYIGLQYWNLLNSPPWTILIKISLGKYFQSSMDLFEFDQTYLFPYYQRGFKKLTLKNIITSLLELYIIVCLL